MNEEIVYNNRGNHTWIVTENDYNDDLYLKCINCKSYTANLNYHEIESINNNQKIDFDRHIIMNDGGLILRKQDYTCNDIKRLLFINNGKLRGKNLIDLDGTKLDIEIDVNNKPTVKLKNKDDTLFMAVHRTIKMNDDMGHIFSLNIIGTYASISCLRCKAYSNRLDENWIKNILNQYYKNGFDDLMFWAVAKEKFKHKICNEIF